MAEWSNAADSKSVVRLSVPGVRIPLSPPLALVVVLAVFTGRGIDAYSRTFPPYYHIGRFGGKQMKLVIAKPSPYARKARVALIEKAIPFETVIDLP